MKLVQAADLHLDSSLRGLPRCEHAPVAPIRRATRRALNILVQLCIDEQVPLGLLSGDLTDGGWPDHATGPLSRFQMGRPKPADIAVVQIRGNHEALSRVPRNLKLPDNVRELGWEDPETVLFLTHHTRSLELAAGAVPAGGLVERRLPPTTERAAAELR